MAIVSPFCAVRPAPDKAAFVVTRAYDSYNEEALTHTLAHNPYSFLQIIHQSTFHKEKPLRERFSFIKEKFEAFKKQQILVPDTKPALYLYELQQRNFKFLGIIGGTSMNEYENGRIKKHEETLAYRENLFMEYLDVVGFNAEPVLLTYPDNRDLNAYFNEKITEPPQLDFTTEPDGDRHRLWVIDDSKALQFLTETFQKIPDLYIADGHHRMASSSLLAKQRAATNPQHTGQEAYNFCLSYLIPETQLKIFSYNRLVKDLNGNSVEGFLKKLSAGFEIENKGTFLYQPHEKGFFSMYLNGHFYQLTQKKTYSETPKTLKDLDAQLLYDELLHPVLGIDDLRNNRRLAYVYGKDSLLKIKENVDSGAYRLGFGLYPASVQEIKNIANQGLSMPPKSTYVIPKLRTGLTVYRF